MAAKCAVVTRFRNTIGLPGRLSVRLQPNHPTDDLAGIAASILDGLLLGAGDAVIGINPATDSPERAHALLAMLEELRLKLDVPTQSCVLAHVTTTLDLITRGSPVDLVSIDCRNAGRQQELRHRSRAAGQAQAAALSLHRGSVGDNVMYFEDRTSSALSAGAHHGVSTSRRWRPALMRSRDAFASPDQHRRRLHRAGISLRRQADHPRRSRGPFLRQAHGPADGLRRRLHQSRRSRSG
jgi:ethanolamine ammonia-lyase large subunit